MASLFLFGVRGPKRNVHTLGAMNSKCDQFFELLSLLIKRYCRDQLSSGAKVAEMFSKFEHLFFSIIDRIKNHPVQEMSRDGPPDQLLIGFFDIVHTLLSFNPQVKRHVASKEGYGQFSSLFLGFLPSVFVSCRLDMIEELWSRCLFPPPPTFSANRDLAGSLKWKESNKCKTSRTRMRYLRKPTGFLLLKPNVNCLPPSCFRLLAALAEDCPENVHDILQLLLLNHTRGALSFNRHLHRFPYCCDLAGLRVRATHALVPELDLATWDRPSGKNTSGFVGLRNPGCICYMNSLLQQIYMTPTLRYGLLSSRVNGRSFIWACSSLLRSHLFFARLRIRSWRERLMATTKHVLSFAT